MKHLHFDFETRSELDIKKVGTDAYFRHPSTKILMMAYAFDDGEVLLWEPHKEPFPQDVMEAFLNPDVLKLAWRVEFERTGTREKLGVDIPIEQWADPAVYSRYASLPGSLDESCKALDLPPELAKSADGKALIHFFSEPIKVRKKPVRKKPPKNPPKKKAVQILMDLGETGPRFRDWNSHPEEWARFCKYCIQDVVAERTIFHLLEPWVRMPLMEREGWILDQKINQRGMPVNTTFAQNAYNLALESKKRLTAQIQEKTGLANPNSRDQMLAWAKTQDYKYGSLEKRAVDEALKVGILTPLCTEVLTLRREAAKTSYNKYLKILDSVCDKRMRNLFIYLGAARTGRWSSYGLQFQNLFKALKAHEKRLDEIRDFILQNNYEAFTAALGSVINAVTSSIRTSFEAPEDHILDVCDLSSIESRVLAWLARCPAKLKVFEENRDTYLDFASMVFGIPYELLEAEVLAGNKERRNLAKPGDLGCGYGLGGGRLETNKHGDTIKTGLWGYAENMGVTISKDFAHKCVKKFREGYPEIPMLWQDLENAVRKVLTTNVTSVRVGPVVIDRLKRKDGRFVMRILLPSGRHLHYMNARVVWQDSKLRTYDNESGDTVSYYTIACACGTRAKLYKPETDVEDFEQKQADFEKIDRSEPLERYCYECGGVSTWYRTQHQAIIYDGIGHGVGRIGAGWGPTYTYGGKLTENIVQAISRDILLHAMLMFDKMGGVIVGHVHDEIIAERDINDELAPGYDALRHCMSVTPSWAPGLKLAAEGFSSKFYKKG